MFRKILLLSSIASAGILSAQWKQAIPPAKKEDKSSNFIKKKYFTLDLVALRSQLSKAQEQGPNSQAVMIQMPTSGEKVETFKVYSFPVVVKSLADRYQLGSYIGVSTENPAKMVRFSVAPNDFQGMIYGDGAYQFIDPEDKSSSLYSLHAKSGPADGKAFVCSTEEGAAAADIARLQQNSTLANRPGNFSRFSDSKYRTMRLALSVTGEYTQAFGGTAGALAQMNATMTRVNGVFEKDFALHLNMQDYPALIYADPNTDPYDTVTGASYPSSWNLSLQTTLTNVVGNANYDIGHLFGASGGGGNAGCVGCVCVDPTTSTPKGKGSGITSPGSGLASGDSFDIDYVAHEMGHQLGANHTFSHSLEGTGVNMEPGSGSSIMGYAGITGSNTDVQAHSDAYFHVASLQQVQANLIAKTCDVEVSVPNTPPTITPFSTITIPKATAFYLTGNATDAEGDPMTFNWEEVDDAAVAITKSNLGTTSTGASFRSVNPSTSMVRYFPAFNTVMNGTLRNVDGWESVSYVPRTTNFRFVARDNSAAAVSPLSQQQTNSANQTVIISNDGPFQLTGNYIDTGANGMVTWDVANTNAASYNSPNVKIDYTTDNGVTWNVLKASTPNDGSEPVSIPASLNGQNIKVRISAIGNVFYAVKQLQAVQYASCDGSAPTNLTVSGITISGANLTWIPIINATYSVRYKPVAATNWNTTTTANPNLTLTGLQTNTQYEVQVAAVCETTLGTYSSSTTFQTLDISYCAVASTYTTSDYIQNVTLANVNNSSTSGTYTNYSSNPSLQINLIAGNQYTVSVTKGWMDGGPFSDAVSVWIDYNRDGVFDTATERIMGSAASTATTVTKSFTVPSTAVTGLPLRMRVIDYYTSTANYVLSAMCGTFGYGEAEDYQVVITSSLATAEVKSTEEISIYPNPASDYLNVKNMKGKVTFSITNAAGQLVDKGVMKEGKIDVRALTTGMYIITLENGNSKVSEKFIKR